MEHMREWLKEVLDRFGIVKERVSCILHTGDKIEWKKEDANNLNVFLRSPTGVKFITAIYNTTQSNNSWATTYEKNKDFNYSAGVASGYQICFSHILNLSEFQQISKQEEVNKAPNSYLERLKA